MSYVLQNPDSRMFVVEATTAGVVWTDDINKAAKWDNIHSAQDGARYFRTHHYATVSPISISEAAKREQFEIVELHDGEWRNAMRGMTWDTHAEALVYFEPLVRAWSDMRAAPYFRIRRASE